jgi:hypothetical protein
METLLSSLLAIIAGLLAIPVTVLCFEIMAALLRPRSEPPAPLPQDPCGRVAVMVPAHNESGLSPPHSRTSRHNCARATGRWSWARSAWPTGRTLLMGGTGDYLHTISWINRRGKKRPRGSPGP